MLSAALPLSLSPGLFYFPQLCLPFCQPLPHHSSLTHSLLCQYFATPFNHTSGSATLPRCLSALHPLSLTLLLFLSRPPCQPASLTLFDCIYTPLFRSILPDALPLFHTFALSPLLSFSLSLPLLVFSFFWFSSPLLGGSSPFHSDIFH